MNLLLDTHTLLWFFEDSPALSDNAKSAIMSKENTCFVSLASAWEAAIKVRLGKLDLQEPWRKIFVDSLVLTGIPPLPILERHIEVLLELPLHHRDPFDRLLISQATVEELVVVTRDTVFSKYGVSCLW